MAVIDNIERITASPTLSLLVSSTILFIVYVVYHTYWRRIPSNAPPVVDQNTPLTGAWGFWTNRWDFYKHARQHSPTGNFSFHAGPNTLVALSGEKSRKIFFESRELGFNEGYAVLLGSSPDLKEVNNKNENDTSHFFSKRLAYLLKTEQLRKKLPTLISDVQDAIEAIRNEPNGITDPFDSIYRVVFRLTIRMVGAEEIAENPALLKSTLRYFEMIDESATATAVMFPKIPSPALLKRTYAGAQLFRLLQGLVSKRAKSGEKHDDALQHMIDQGDRIIKIIEFVVGALFAGQLNSGINAAWVLCYLAASPEWLSKARNEVKTVAAKYATNPNAPLSVQLDDVPLEAWEAEFPVVDMCLRDSIRLNLLGSAFRKNITNKPISTGHGDEVIPPGAFVTYATGDVMLNPDIYPDPEKWDPSRYEPHRAEDKKAEYGFIGWGVGRHPCLGMRFAKLEQNIITAYFLAAFDFHLVDQSGRKLDEAPKVDFNAHSAHKPKSRPLLKVIPTGEK